MVQAKDELSHERANHAERLSGMQKEMVQLANDLATSRHDYGVKSAELNAKISEADNLQVMLMEAQKTIERLTEDNKRLESELLAKGTLEEEMTDLKEEIECLKKQLGNANAAMDESNDVVESLQAELSSTKELLAATRDAGTSKDFELADLHKALEEAKDALASSDAELARITALFEESQRLLAARDFSLAEALKNVEFFDGRGEAIAGRAGEVGTYETTPRRESRSCRERQVRTGGRATGAASVPGRGKYELEPLEHCSGGAER